MGQDTLIEKENMLQNKGGFSFQRNVGAIQAYMRDEFKNTVH